jgi:hypothetical protein
VVLRLLDTLAIGQMAAALADGNKPRRVTRRLGAPLRRRTIDGA